MNISLPNQTLFSRARYSLIAGCVLGAMALVQPARAAYTYTAGTVNADKIYDGLGVDSALDPCTKGGTGDKDYIGSGGIGSLTVQSGTLTNIVSDLKIGRNANSTGTVSVVSGTFTVSQTGTYGGGVGVNNGTSPCVGIVNISSGATMNWFLSGSSEQKFQVGNNGVNTRGTVNLNGGTFNLLLDPAQALTDAAREFTIGQTSANGILNLNAGTFAVQAGLPVGLGGDWANMNFTPTFNSSGTGRINILNGSFVDTGIAVEIDTTKTTFRVGTTSYVNFIPGGTGQLSLANWTQDDYKALVDAGQIRVDGTITSISSFSFSSSGGQGILRLADPAISVPAFSPTNTAYAGERCVVSVTAQGTGPFTCQWQWDSGSGGATFTDIPGANSLSYTQDTTGLLGAYQYRVVVTNSLGSANTSGAATLTVNPASAPFVTVDTTPAAASRYLGGTVSFRAVFDGNKPMSYQWQVDKGSGFVGLTDATNSVLILTNLQYADAGDYRLVATNSAGDAVSTNATLSLLDPAGLQFTWSAPVAMAGLTADQILSKTLGGAQGVVGAAVFGSTAPIAVGLSDGRTMAFLNDGSVATCLNGGLSTGAYPAGTTNTTGNTNFNAVLNQFRADGGPKTITLQNLTVGERYAVQLFALDDRTANTNRLCNFQDGDDPAVSVETSGTVAMGDNAYVVGTFTASNVTETIRQNLPTGNAGAMNALVLRAMSFVPANPPLVLAPPQSQTVFAGRPARFNIVASSDVAPGYQWQTNNVDVGNGALFSGATTDTLVISNSAGLEGSYSVSCVVSNPAGPAVGGPATLNVLAVPPGSGAAGAKVLSLNPVAYWPLNETFDVAVGGMLAYDAVGTHDGAYLPSAYNAFNGILGPQDTNGYPQFAEGQGALGPRYLTADSWVTTPGVSLNTASMSISMWLYPDGSQAANAGLYVNRNSGSVCGLINRTTSNELGYMWNNNESATFNHATGLLVPANVWSYVALVVTPTNVTWYLYNTNNGMATHTWAHTHTSSAWSGANQSLIRIGNDDASNLSRVFNGRIDELALFNRPLGSNEVFSLAGLTVVPPVNTTPTSLVSSVAGGNLTLSWPADHTGWTLQAQTNALAVGLGTNWFPVSGSTATNQVMLPVGTSDGSVFFRLVYP